MWGRGEEGACFYRSLLPGTDRDYAEKLGDELVDPWCSIHSGKHIDREALVHQG
jgi:hypothetical protein